MRQSLSNLAVDIYRQAVWSPLTGVGSARERLTSLLGAVMDASEADLALLSGLQSAEESPFHQPGGGELPSESPFTDPIERLLRDGESDGSLSPCDYAETATLIFNAVGWTYIHLRHAHRWNRERAQAAILRLVMDGL